MNKAEGNLLKKYKTIGLLNIHPNFDFTQTQKN